MTVWMLLIIAFAGGYAASIFSWSWVKEHVNGAVTEARNLRTKAEALEAKIRSKI